MPDVGLFTATDPLPREAKVIIKFTVSVEGLPVYNESYDVDKLAAELEEDRKEALKRWARRIECVVACRHRPGFSACLTRCLADGQACDCGSKNAESVD